MRFEDKVGHMPVSNYAHDWKQPFYTSETTSHRLDTTPLQV